MEKSLCQDNETTSLAFAWDSPKERPASKHKSEVRWNQGFFFFFLQVCLDFSSYEISFLNEGRAKKAVLKPNSISKPAAAVWRSQMNKSFIQSCSTQRSIIRRGIFAAEPWLLGLESLPAYNIMLNGHVTTNGLLLLIKLNSWFWLVGMISAHSSSISYSLGCFKQDM